MPPGTGVIQEHFGDTPSNCTSPFKRKPLFLVASGTLVIPTSRTTAPSFTISAVTNSARPKAATRISACKEISFMFFVFEWQTVTVQLPGLELLLSRMLIGL